MHGAKNVYWIVYPNITLPAGKYLVLDSDPATWSHNAGTKGIGFTQIFSTTNKTNLPNKSSNTNVPQKTKVSISQNKHLGCYTDKTGVNRDLKGYTFKTGNMTNQLCQKTCADKGFQYAATQYGSHCFCGNSYEKYSTSNNRNMGCSGNKNETCGGGWANSVYKI
ncbi:MAG: hypothetical protein ACI9TV_002028 [Sulfurimonas sp.]|jgi:hypothetical protein|uniref:WSC domain-containing protein n=1 Tax=Sulfurimonas sp. TaxID=2022749 RepID=UPI0039E5B49C